MSLFGVQINHQINRIITEIRLNIQKHKLLPNVRTIYRSFGSLDQEISGQLPPKLFEKGLNQNGIFFKNVDLQILEKAYSTNSGKVNWFQFLSALKIPMNQRRIEFVTAIFDSFGQQSLTPQNIFDRFDPSEIQLFKTGKATKQYLKEQLVSLLSLPDGFLTKEQFIAFYDDLSLNYPHDQPFEKYVSLQWGYQAQKSNRITVERLKQFVKALRFKLIQKSKGTNDEFLLTKLFNQYDQNKNGFISSFELDLMLKKLQLPIPQEAVEPLFKKLDKNQSGNIQYDEFKRFIFFDPYQI